MARYKVVGPNHRVFGAGQGEFIEVHLTTGQERALVEGGHIVPVPKRERPRRRGGNGAVVKVKQEVPPVVSLPPELDGDGASESSTWSSTYDAPPP